MSQTTFRCPYEVKALEEGAILSVHLECNHDARMLQFARALSGFYKEPSLVGLRFVLPRSFRDSCTTLQSLILQVLPFQCEVLASEIDYRFSPYLPYHGFNFTEDIEPSEIMPVMGAYALSTAISNLDGIRSASDVADWLQRTFQHSMAGGVKNPQLVILENLMGSGKPILRITPGSLMVEYDRNRASDPLLNRNLFSIVRCPLYPKEFGRHSEDLEIVLTREAHFVAVPTPIREKIRQRSNEVLEQGGVHITDRENDKQNTGLWIP